MRDLVEITGCGKSTVHRILNADLKMSKTSARWVPRLLSEDESLQECSQNAKKLRTSKGDYLIKQCFSSIASLFKLGTSLEGKNSLLCGSEFLHLRAVPFGVENHFYYIR